MNFARCKQVIVLVALFAAGYNVWYWATKPKLSVSVPPALIESTCAWPKNEGEMTVITVYGGRTVCWRWK